MECDIQGLNGGIRFGKMGNWAFLVEDAKRTEGFFQGNPASSDSTADIPGSKRKERGQKGVSGRQMGVLKLTAAVAVWACPVPASKPLRLRWIV